MLLYPSLKIWEATGDCHPTIFSLFGFSPPTTMRLLRDSPDYILD